QEQIGTFFRREGAMANMKRRWEAPKIILFATLAAITYGILHDQVTAHLCVEYFTIAHPPVFPTQSPFLLAIGWGIIATWWVGLPLGILLAMAARIGPAPKLNCSQLAPAIVKLMIITAIAAVVIGTIGALLVAAHVTPVPGGWDAMIPPDRQIAFSADAWAHLASYGFGALGGLLLVGHTLWSRIHSPRIPTI
ncbi:MAG TPA: hypothetical protein VFL92_09015, partial [Sphingomonas sp.]|nr:hypothetical protein [Sphingomonas sp.]